MLGALAFKMKYIQWLLPFIASDTFAAFIFFHEPSMTVIRPLVPINNYSDFGFSLAYQAGSPPNLIVGAPHETLKGEVYTCPLQVSVYERYINCDIVPIHVYDLMNKPTREERNLFFGSSISATRDFFLTCAPHWTDWEMLNDTNYPSMGVCFIYNGTAHRMKGPSEQFFEGRIGNKLLLAGGYGWSLLSDDINHITIIPKSSPRVADIMTLDNTDPLSPTSSMIAANIQNNQSNIMNKKMNSNHFRDIRNPGYAIAAGNFFNKDNYYAISETQNDMIGRITFYKYLTKDHELAFAGLKKYPLSDGIVGSMFGAVLFSADLNRDGLSDLLIGAPTHPVEGGFENGAVHIFFGDSLQSIPYKYRIRSIYYNIDGARFGSAIVSADLDHDGFPESIISAPYAEGTGVVYIISGSEVYEKFFTDSLSSVNLNSLKLVQKIQNTEYKTFGYSLQVIPDLNENACDELAVGAPESGKVFLYPCSASVNVTLSAKLKGIKFLVPEDENNFTVEVCVIASDHFNSQNKVLDFMVTNEIIGNAFMGREYANFSMQVSFTNETVLCKDVLINLSTNDPEFYQFKTEVQLSAPDLKTNQDNTSAISLSLYSETKASLDVVRKCEGEECMPHLNSSLLWSGNSSYTLGSSSKEHLTLKIRNDGNSTYSACARVRIEGAQVLRIGCEKAAGFYVCNLPKPMKRFQEISYKIHLNMSSTTNQNKSLDVTISLYNFCEQSNYSVQFLRIPFNVEASDISLSGLGSTQTVTERDLQSTDTVTITNTFTVINNGSVTWEHLPVDIDYIHQPHLIKKISFDCGTNHKTPVNSSCILDKLVGNSSINIKMYMEFNKTQLRTLFKSKDPVITIKSSIKLLLLPTEIVKYFSLFSNISITSEELSFWHSKILVISISVLVAVIGLAAILAILIKVNFFKRKQKEKLEDLKNNIRRRSIASEDQARDVQLRSLRHRKISNMGKISEENLVDETKL